jgi:hypothetical protein
MDRFFLGFGYVSISVRAAFWRTNKDDFARNNLRPVFLVAVVPVFPTWALQPAFDIKFRTLLNELAHDFGQPLPGEDVVPFRPVLPLARFVLKSLSVAKLNLAKGTSLGGLSASLVENLGQHFSIVGCVYGIADEGRT